MNRIFRWEWKKLWKTKTILFSLSALLFLLVVYLYGSYSLTGLDMEVYKENYESAVKQEKDNLETVKLLQSSAEKSKQEFFTNEIVKSEKRIQLAQDMLDAFNANDWKRELAAKIQSNQIMLEDRKKGTVIGGNSIKEDEQELSLLQYFSDHSIRPFSNPNINGNYDVNGLNTLYMFLKDLAGTLVPLVALLLAAGILPGEKKNGTLKLLLQQPVPRWRVLAAKFCAALLTSFPFLLLSGGVLFLAASLIGGTGDPRYPVPAAPGLNGSFLIGESSYTTVQNFLQQFLPLLCVMMIFYTALGLFISVLAPNGGAAALAAILFAILPQLLGNAGELPFLKYLPFFMNDGFQMLSGTGNGLPLPAVFSVLAGSAVLLSALSVFLFRKKDILC